MPLPLQTSYIPYLVIVKVKKNMEERVNALCTAFQLPFQSLTCLIQHANADLTQDDKLDKVT